MPDIFEDEDLRVNLTFRDKCITTVYAGAPIGRKVALYLWSGRNELDCEAPFPCIQCPLSAEHWCSQHTEYNPACCQIRRKVEHYPKLNELLSRYTEGGFCENE
jgi:hypothetical protein